MTYFQGLLVVSFREGNCWFGARWFGILGIPLHNKIFHKGILGIQTINPNQQFFMTAICPGPRQLANAA